VYFPRVDIEVAAAQRRLKGAVHPERRALGKGFVERGQNAPADVKIPK
jgi:hypothetical protein